MAISTASESGGNGLIPGWVGLYLGDHLIHLLVILTFVVYPALYWFLAGDAGAASIWILLLPSMTTMIEVLYFGVFAMSFDFISGYTGYLSFGHSLFFGAGLFFVIGARRGLIPFFGEETGFMVLLGGAMVVSFLIAVLVGLVSFRLTGVYFAMITLGFAELVRVFMVGYIGSDTSFTGPGEYGIGIPFLSDFQLPVGPFGSQIVVTDIPVVGSVVSLVTDTLVLGQNATTFYLVGAVVLVAYFAMQRIIHSPFGRVMVAIRENEERAKAVGYNTYWYKLTAFAISGAFGAVGGALAAAVNKSGNPETHFSVIEISGDALLATIIGGMGTLAGPLYGYVFDLNLAEFFGGKGSGGLVRFLEGNFAGLVDTSLAFGMTVGDYLNTIVQGHSGLFIGVVFIFFILYVPGGFLGTVRNYLGGPLAKTVRLPFTGGRDEES